MTWFLLGLALGLLIGANVGFLAAGVFTVGRR